MLISVHLTVCLVLFAGYLITQEVNMLMLAMITGPAYVVASFMICISSRWLSVVGLIGPCILIITDFMVLLMAIQIERVFVQDGEDQSLFLRALMV